MQKTWLQLLGPYRESCRVSGCFIVENTSPTQVRVLFRFDNEVYARQALEIWKIQTEQAQG